MKVLGIMLAKMTLCMIAVSMSATAADRGTFITSPTPHGDQRWRIGYYEGGEYIDYQKVLMETVRGLMKLGWVERAEIPEQQGEQTHQLWKWLAANAKSDYIEFVADAHYSGNWDEATRERTITIMLDRLNGKGDIDLMIAMGTLAGKDLASDRHKTPTMVLSASDPISAGIVASVEDSGHEHVHAWVDPFRFERQIKVFHDIIGFQTLGVAYEDTVSGRSYAAIETIEKLSKERRFKIERCYTQSDISDSDIAEKSVLACFERFAKSVDAVYVTQQGGVNQRSIPDLARIANAHHIPTFSQAGSEEVKYGFLASLSQAGFKYVGEFHATTIAKVFNGARPNQLDQLFEEPPKIAINLETAEIIGFVPPLLLLGAADEIYQEIALPQ